MYLGDIADARFRLFPFHGLFVSLSLCMSDTFVHYAQTTEAIDTISFAYDSSMSLTHRVIIWLALVDQFLPKSCPKMTHAPVNLGIIRHSTANCGRMLEIAQWSQWKAYRKPPSLFRMVSSLTPTSSPSRKMGVANAPLTRKFATSAATTWRL